MTTIPIWGVSITPEVACLASVSQSQLWEPVLLSGSVSLPFMDVSCKWKDTVRGLLHLASFT